MPENKDIRKDEELKETELKNITGGAGIDDDLKLLNDAFKGPQVYGFAGPKSDNGDILHH